MDYDVLIVGAGPCGLIAARDIAKGGGSVCVVEKSPEIGYPVKCSGLFSISGLEQIGVKVDKSIICSTIRGGRFYSPGGNELMAYSKMDRARVVERKMFDKALAKEAVREGATIKLKTNAQGFVRKKGVELKILEMGKEKTLRSPLLIGADGAGSNVAAWAGISRVNRFVSAVQTEVASADLEEDIADVYFGKNYAPGFYGWILPKGEVFEIGVGSIGGMGETPRKLLRKFMEEHPIASKKIDSSKIVEFNMGSIPVGGPGETVSENVILIGDAAAQTKASTGGGVVTGGVCARIAAEAALIGIDKSNFSLGFLRKEYDEKWRKELEKEFLAHLFLRNLIDSASDSELDSLFRILKEEGVPDLMTRYSDTDRPLDFIREMLKKEPVLKWSQQFLNGRKYLG